MVWQATEMLHHLWCLRDQGVTRAIHPKRNWSALSQCADVRVHVGVIHTRPYGCRGGHPIPDRPLCSDHIDRADTTRALSSDVQRWLLAEQRRILAQLQHVCTGVRSALSAQTLRVVPQCRRLPPSVGDRT